MTRNDLPTLFQQHFKTGSGAEIGVQYGHYSQRICASYIGQLYCVDTWPDDAMFQNVQERLSECTAILLPLSSCRAATSFPDESMDFVYIDADHSYEQVSADIEAWFNKVRVGGIVAGHDYVTHSYDTGTEFGVIKAVNEFCRDHGYTVSLTENDWYEGKDFKSWYFIK